MKRTKWDWFFAGSVFFGSWAVANTLLSITRYGFDQGVFWWFCNLALIGTAYGLLKKDRGVLLAFLSIACFTQVFWLIDNVYRIATGGNLFGLVEFLYRPGLPLDEFILAHYHYFTLPVCLTALYFLGKSKKRSNAWRIALLLNPLIFAASYFLFPAEQNINCIHTPCLAGSENLTGPLYSLSFWTVIFALHLGALWYWEGLFNGLVRTPARSRNVTRLFAATCLVAIFLGVLDTQVKLAQPALVCAPDTWTKSVRIGCEYTLDHSPGNMVFRYRVTNLTDSQLLCRAEASTQFSTFTLSGDLELAGGESRSFARVLPYPDASVRVVLDATCEAGEPRAIASSAPARLRDAR